MTPLQGYKPPDAETGGVSAIVTIDDELEGSGEYSEESPS
jgi:hypothetical protein